VEDIDQELLNPTDKRIFAISSAFHRGYSVQQVHEMTNIDQWFLNRLHGIYEMEGVLSYVLAKERNYMSYRFQ
jgi:carbamoyl-phosphate synthase/aspartate carbamoyltransferase